MSKISIQGNASGTGTLTIAAPNTNTDRTLTLPDATGTINTSGAVNEVPAGSASAPAIYPTGDSNTGIFFPAADTVAVATGGSERMRIDSSGNVGIGTSSPGYKLEVYGATNASQGWNAGGTVTGFAQANTSNADFRIGTITNHALGFYTNSTERARITSGGDLLVGQTSGSSYADARVVISRANYPQLSLTSSNSNGCTINFYEGTTLGAKIGGLSSQVTTYFQVQCGGSGGVQLASGGTSWGSMSDERLKNVTGTIDNALDSISQIKPVKFTWKHDENNTPQVGVLAQSVLPVLPEAVQTDVKINKEDETEYLAIKYTELIPLLISGIQELKAITDAQATRIEALEAEVAALKG